MRRAQLNQRVDAKRDVAVVQEELRFWDPIGILRGPRPLVEKGSHDEYDQYAPEVLRMLQRGATAREIQLHLNGIPTGLMELKADPVRDRETVDRLVAWWRSRNVE